MDRFPLMIICIFAHLTCHAQDAAKIFVQKDNGLYLVEHNRSYLVNDKIVTVKLKEKQETPNFKVVRSNKLGYIDIAVPNGVDIQKYVNYLGYCGWRCCGNADS